MKTKEPKKYLGTRIDPSLLGRIDRITVKSRGNRRMVIEQCLDAHLPILERQYGEDGPGGDPSAHRQRAIQELSEKFSLIVKGNDSSMAHNALHELGTVAFNRRRNGSGGKSNKPARRNNAFSNHGNAEIKSDCQQVAALHQAA